MKVVVTGGTGFVGRELVTQLALAGYQIDLLTRHPRHEAAVKLARRTGAHIVSGDVFDRSSLDAFQGAGAIIHLVGIISESRRNTFENAHVRATENVVAAARAAGVSRFLHMSALGTRPDAVSRYHQTKWQAEQIVRNSGLDWTIFRPSIIYGPGDQFVNRFTRIARWSPVVPVLGRGTFQPIPVREVAWCFVRALDQPASIGKTFDLVGPEVLTMAEILKAILATAGRRRLLVRVPLLAARLLARLLEACSRITDRKSVV